MILKAEGIVLRTFDFRETSRIATFFTKEHGKVSGILKGIRKDSKKFGSSLDLFSVNDIVYYQYRNSDLHLISQCDLKQYFLSVRQDLAKTLAATYVLELINKIMPVEEKNIKIYQLLLDFLGSLEGAKDVHPLVHGFQIKTLLHSGFKPHLDTCIKCGRVITGRAKFSMHDGGLVCLQCPLSETVVHWISQGTVSSILHIEKNDWSNCLKLHMAEATRRELKYILNNFLVFHLGRKLLSAKYLHA
jgi:DNA repair protein RecO (recombination protein O)